jgi:iron(III) transport system permease protein
MAKQTREIRAFSRLPMKKRPLRPAGILIFLGLLAFFFLVYSPIAVLLLGLVGRLIESPALRQDLLSLALPLEAPGPALFARSLAIALSASVGAGLIGLLAALRTQTWRNGWKRRLRWAPVALLALPAYVHALAWSTTIHGISRLLPPGLRPPSIGAPVAAFVQGMTLLPLAYAVAIVALDLVPDRLVDAARVLHDEPVLLRRIVVPLCLPVIAAGVASGFLTSLLDYSIPALYQTSVLSLKVFADYSAQMDASRATLISAPIILSGIAAAWILQRGGRKAALAPRRAGPSTHEGTRLKGPLVWAASAGAAILAFQFVLTFAGLLRAVGDAGRFVETLAPARDDLAFSLAVALGAGLISIPPALALATRMTRPESTRWWLLAMLPLAFPGPLVGIGLIRFWNGSILSGLPVYGSAWMPVLAALARFLPVAALILAAQLWRVDPTLIDAARLQRRSRLQSLFAVEIPLIMPGLVAAFGLVFAFSLGEIGATVLIQPPGLQTLTVRAFNALHFGSSESVAGLCLAMAILAYSVAAASISVFGGGLRLLREGTRS